MTDSCPSQQKLCTPPQPAEMNSTSHPAAIVFSDLDGTLLDHSTYSHASAEPALERLRRMKCPLILASSKTAREIAQLRREIGFEHCPAIVENGSGLMQGGPVTLNPEIAAYTQVRAALDEIPFSLRQKFSGFGDWSTDEVAQRTGLDVGRAELARMRQYSEPGVWSGDERELARFIETLGSYGIAARRGGRFLTLSLGGSKADRMDEVVTQFSGEGALRPVTLALGDAPNDMEMLQHADRGVVVRNSTGPGVPTLAGEESGTIARTLLEGPAGWNEAVLRFLDEIG